MLDHLVDDVDDVDDVDGVDHVALTLFVTTERGTHQLVGVARILRYPDDPTATALALSLPPWWQWCDPQIDLGESTEDLPRAHHQAARRPVFPWPTCRRGADTGPLALTDRARAA